MLREIFREVNPPTQKSRLTFCVAERYQIGCSLTEAIRQLTNLKLQNCNNKPNSAAYYQMDVINKIIEDALIRPGSRVSEGKIDIIDKVWESDKGMASLIIRNTQEVNLDANTRSWLIKLLTDNFDPQHHLEEASRLGLIGEIDPYDLRAALFVWKGKSL